MMKPALLFCLNLIAITAFSQTNGKQFAFNKQIKISHSEIDSQYKRFTPTVRDLQLADSISKIHIKKNHAKYPWTAEITDYNSYYHQYVGYLNGKQEKIIFVNSFCSVVQDWKTQLVQTSGGGSCYFNIKVDLSTRKAYNLNVNSP